MVVAVVTFGGWYAMIYDMVPVGGGRVVRGACQSSKLVPATATR